jgi:hypothetical protein
MHKQIHRTPLAGTLIAAFGAALATAAGAHHAITLNYDSNLTGSVEGVVEEVFWANPHTHFYISVTDEDGSTKLWDVESGNLNTMRSRGVSRDTIKVGDVIRAYGILGRDGHEAILADAMIKADGTVIYGDPADVTGADNARQDD